MASKVLYLEHLPSDCYEELLHEALTALGYGTPCKIVLLRKRNAMYADYDPVARRLVRTSNLQALVEMSDVEVATNVLTALEHSPLLLQEHAVTASFSRNQELYERTFNGSGHCSIASTRQIPSEPSRILLVTVQNPTIPITTDLIHDVFAPYGEVEKVVVFVKPVGLQCLVQFATPDQAFTAKHTLHGLCLFPDCCALIVHFSNLPQLLVVKENGVRTKDYTDDSLPLATNTVPVNVSAEAMSSSAYEHNEAGTESAASSSPTPITFVSPVLLVCNLRESVTCDHLFNLFSCYGNVARIKKLRGKLDHALIQFASHAAAQSALLRLRGFTLFGQSMEISYSRHAFISIRPGAGAAMDSETPLMREYGYGANRFGGKHGSGSKHIYSPTKIVHVSNIDDSVTTEEQLATHFGVFEGGDWCRFKLFSNSSGHHQALAEFASVDAATSVLAQAHNQLLAGRRLRLAFSLKSIHPE